MSYHQHRWKKKINKSNRRKYLNWNRGKHTTRSNANSWLNIFLRSIYELGGRNTANDLLTIFNESTRRTYMDMRIAARVVVCASFRKKPTEKIKIIICVWCVIRYVQTGWTIYAKTVKWISAEMSFCSKYQPFIFWALKLC